MINCIRRSLLGMVLIPKLAHCSRQRSLQRCPQCSFFSHMEVQSFLDSFFPHSIFTLCPHFGITFSTSILERKAVWSGLIKEDERTCLYRQKTLLNCLLLSLDPHFQWYMWPQGNSFTSSTVQVNASLFFNGTPHFVGTVCQHPSSCSIRALQKTVSAEIEHATRARWLHGNRFSISSPHMFSSKEDASPQTTFKTWPQARFNDMGAKHISLLGSRKHGMS